MPKNYQTVPERPYFDNDAYGNAFNIRIPIFSKIGRGPKGPKGDPGLSYEPIFAGDWDIHKFYKQLSIVYYNGNSYTAKQDVPINTPITNEEYWFQSGNFNAQYYQLNNKVITLTNQIDILTQYINDIQSEISTIDTSSKSIYDYFKNYNIVIIGDSFASGTGCSDHHSGDTKRWSSLLASYLQATEFNYAVGSTGFCDPGSGGQNAAFKTQVLNAANNMTTTQKNNTHLVVIAGGVNDYREESRYNQSDMQAGTSEATYNARVNFPNANILVVPMLFQGHDANPRLLAFENAIIYGSGGTQTKRRTYNIRGAWTWNFGMRSHYTSDDLHPNDLGHSVIAANIYTHILGGSAYEGRLLELRFNDGFSSNVANGGYLHFYNGIIQSYGTLLTINDVVNANQLTLIGTVPPLANPLVNLVWPVMKGNNIVGTFQITSNGNMYINLTQNVSENIYIPSISYLPKGALN